MRKLTEKNNGMQAEARRFNTTSAAQPKVPDNKEFEFRRLKKELEVSDSNTQTLQQDEKEKSANTVLDLRKSMEGEKISVLVKVHHSLSVKDIKE